MHAPKIDPHSIQFRLTAGILLATLLSIGGVAGWTVWRMQQILLTSHKQNTADIAERFNEDVALYAAMMPTTEAVQKVIDHHAIPSMAIWVEAPDGSIMAQSDTLSMSSWQVPGISQALLTLDNYHGPRVHTISDRYLALCVTPLVLNHQVLGTLFVAEDITQGQKSFLAVIQSLALVSFLVILCMAVVIALYVRRSLQPLRELSQLTASVSARDLGAAQLTLHQSPTEVRELAQTCQNMLDRLSDAWEQQRRFVSDISHELRTPLSLVLGYLQSTLRRCDVLTAPQREGLEIAMEETQRTIRILQDLLDLARADSGDLRLNWEWIDLKELVLEVVEMAQPMTPHVIAQIDTWPVTVQTDRIRLKQVLLNLVDNAVRYSPQDSPVTVQLSQIGNQAYIRVCDRGRGIPLADQEMIFAPFYRVDDDRARTTGGTGLGLTIVRTIMEHLGGSVSVQSRPGEGSVFTVRLPMASPSQGEMMGARSHAPPDLP